MSVVSKSANSSTERLLSKTRETLSLLMMNIFGEDLNAKDKAFSSLLGSNSWREICDHIISTCLTDPIASSTAEGSDCIAGSTAHLMASFEEFCSSIGFIPSSVRAVKLNNFSFCSNNNSTNRMATI